MEERRKGRERDRMKMNGKKDRRRGKKAIQEEREVICV